MHETGQWPNVVVQVAVTASKKKPKATKCSDHRTFSLIAHTAKMVARIEGGLKGKLRMY
jgi:hypothetical protein